jgi:hypothetical protein
MNNPLSALRIVILKCLVMLLRLARWSYRHFLLSASLTLIYLVKPGKQHHWVTDGKMLATTEVRTLKDDGFANCIYLLLC